MISIIRGRGISLLELLVVIMITAILALISLPLLSQFVARSRRSTLQHDLLSTIHYARIIALSNNTRVTFCPSDDKIHCSNDWHNTWVVFNDPDRQLAIHKKNIIRVMHGVSVGELQLSAFPKANYLRFNQQGLPDNQNGTFQYCYKQSGWKLIFNRRGRVRKEEGLSC